MKHTRTSRPMAWLLTLALLLSFLPTTILPAQAAGGRTIKVSTYGSIQAAYDNASAGDTIEIDQYEVKLLEQLRLSKPGNITFVSTLKTKITVANNSDWSTYPSNNKPVEMVQISGTADITFKGVTFNANTACRNIAAINSSRITLINCTVQNGSTTASNGGAGIIVSNDAHLTAKGENGGETLFTNNVAQTTSASPGGAVYLSSVGSGATLEACSFIGNKANSGGAIYVYGGTVTATADTIFENNSADQRGNAIHDHGTVVLKGTRIEDHGTSGTAAQYGGAVYVSANTTGSAIVHGTLVLDGATIQNNRAANSGAGIYVADGGYVFVGNGTTISDNTLSETSGVPEKFRANNVYVPSPGSKLIAFSDTGKIGISTSNAYWPQMVTYSTATVTDVTIPGSITGAARTYTMQKEAAAKFTYDSEVWLTKDFWSDKKAVALGGEYKEGNIWLGINPTYVDIGSCSSAAVFDLNVPNQAAITMPGNPGDKKEHPSVSNITQGQVSYKFLGWFDAPSGGSPAPNPVVLQNSIKVYYAQWRVEVTGGGGSETGKGDMRLVYFDQNIAGGGVTTSYITSGQFSFTVEFEWKDPTKPDSKPITKYDTVTVSLPFGFPGDPYRPGYIFKGWGTTAMATTPVANTWRPTDYVTTLYGIWAANQYTMTWNSNGGSSVAATTQAHDQYVTPPATAPTRNGYTFDGWYLDKGCTIPLTSGTKITGPMTFYAGWAAQIMWSANYTGGAMTTTQQKDGENLQMPPDPVREGYSFDGWYTSATGGSKVTSSTKVSGNANYYAHWTVSVYTITWDKNTGDTGGGTTRVNHGAVIDPPTVSPTKTGYTFTGWYLDKACTTPFVNGAIATKNQTFYAGWTPNEFTIQWDANYTGGGTTTIKQHYDEELVIPPDPTRVGFVFGGWYTQPGGAGTRAEAYGTVTKDENFYANWVREAQSYTVNIEWDDLSDNDLVRPGSIRVQLMANDLPTGMSYLFTQADADAGGNLWSHTFTGLPITDVISQPITYSVAITSPVSDEYSYGIENKSATLGYILMTHSLITTDINSYVVWADSSNNDGYRPSTVSLQLYANGEKINDAEGRVALSGSGDTWTYSFKDFQKFYTDADGNKGLEIVYTLVATATNPGELGKYSIAYKDYTVILTHAKDTISKTVGVEWNDSNDKDGKRPASMTVQLYADNVPVQGKYVTLSDANHWSYTWNDLPKLTAAGRKVVYSAQVTSTLVDYTAKSTEMTIEMAYVPSSTSITAFALWTDQNDADGLRPDFITAELVADGKATGDKQVLTAVNGWTTAWKNYPMYKDGNRIEYTFRISPMPNGYRADYKGVYDTSGLSVTLTHDRELTDQTATIVWNDRNNVSGDRMDRVCVQLYADGVAVEDTHAWVTEEDGWQHTYKDLPMYKNGGELIRYSVYLFSSVGKYKAATEGMTLTLNLDVERVDIPLHIIWNDNNNANGLRPLYVGVILLVDNEVSKYQLTATEENGWSTTFTGMVRFGFTADGDGHAFKYTARVIVPAGYEVEYIADTAVLSMAAAKADYHASVIWNDNDNQYGVRPAALNLYLWADYQDGIGYVQVSNAKSVTAADGWQTTFTNLPVYQAGKEIRYAVRVAENASYIPSYDGMTVTMTHKDTPTESGKSDFPVTLVWTDNKNANGSRPASVDVTLLANGVEVETYTATENDVSGAYTWGHTFTGLPTYQGGGKIKYTVRASVVANYTARVQSNSIIFTHVQDIAIKLYWDDNGNVDGSRPASLNLNLYADNREIGVSKSVTGTGGIWSCVFKEVPVWSTVNNTKAAVYTWLPDVEEITALERSGYSMDYHGYEPVGTPAAYRVDLSRNVELADYSATLNWSDDTDRDGKRPTELSVKLYADYGDGKGAVDTGKTATVKGGNEDAAWRYMYTGLPVWANQGKRVIYSIRPADLDGYKTVISEDGMAATLTHTPMMVDVIASVVWDDATNAGGIPRFNLTGELMIDGERSRLIGGLTKENSYAQSWGKFHVYHDHGTAYDYTFNFSDTAHHADYEITVDGWVATVRRVRFNVGGTILDKLGNPVSGADVTLYDSDKLAVGSTTSGSDGRYAFSGLEVKSFTIRGNKNLNGKQTGTAEITITNADLTNVDIRLMPDSGGGEEEYTYTLTGTVKDSNGLPAMGATVSVFNPAMELVGSATADATGRYRVTKLPNGTYQLAVVYALDGKDYTAAGQAVTIFNADKSAPVITVTVPKPEQPTDKPCVVSGKVTNELGKVLADILVVVYGPDETRYTAVVTDDMGGYKLSGVPDGKYKLLFYYAGTAVVSKEITVNSEAELKVPDVAIDTTAKTGLGTLAGVAVDAQGKPVEGAEVYVYAKDGEQVGYQKTAKNGAYRFDLPVGEYLLEIRKPFDNTTDTTVDVNDGTAGGGSVTADTFTIAGTVLDTEGKGVEGVTVYLYGTETAAIQEEAPLVTVLREALENALALEEGALLADPIEADDGAAADDTVQSAGAFVRLMETVTDAEGNYEFKALPAGEYVVKIAHGIGGNGGSIDIPVTAGPGSTTPEDSNVTVTTESYTCSGVVEDKNGNPVAGAVVTLTDSRGNQTGEVITGDDGRYEFPGLTEDTYTLTISYPDFEILGGGKVEIEEGGTVVFQGHAVSGMVKDEKGNPIKGAVIVLTNSETKAEYLTATDKDGKFRTAAPNGTYTIMATYDGKETTATVTVNNKDVTVPTMSIKLSTSGGDNPGGNPGGGDNPSGGGGSGGGNTGGSGGSGGGGSGGGGAIIPQGRQVKAYIFGLPDGAFGPALNITRAEVAAILSRVTEGFDPTTPYKHSFSDVPAGAWYEANVGFCVAKGLMNGRGAGTFAPDASITRAEFAAVVARLLALPNAKGKASFPDVPGTWAEGYISQLADKGIIMGLPDGTFAPDALITRAEVVTIVNRALTRGPDRDNLTALVNAGKAGFADMTAAHWAYYQVIEASVDHTHK